MFVCQSCRKQISAGVNAHRIIVERRLKVYPHREKAIYKIIDSKRKKINDLGGVGWEIAREKIVCPSCACHPKLE